MRVFLLLLASDKKSRERGQFCGSALESPPAAGDSTHFEESRRDRGDRICRAREETARRETREGLRLMRRGQKINGPLDSLIEAGPRVTAGGQGTISR